MPTHYGVGFDDHEDLRPVGPESAQEHPKATVQIREPWPFHRALEHGELLPKSEILERQRAACFERREALLHGPEQIADLPVPVAESPGAVRIGHPERSHLVEYLAPNSVFNSLPRQRSSPHLRPDDRLVTIDRVLHHASLGVA